MFDLSGRKRNEKLSNFQVSSNFSTDISSNVRHLTWTSTKVFINHVSGVFVTYSNVSAEYSDNSFINKNLNYEGTCHTAERSNIYTLKLYTSDQGRNSLVATLRWEKKILHAIRYFATAVYYEVLRGSIQYSSFSPLQWE